MPSKARSFGSIGGTDPGLDLSRASTTERGYGWKWRRLQRWWIGRNPLCVMCGGAAEDVDHIVPLSRGGTNKHSNLQSLCRFCHKQKHVRNLGGIKGLQP